MDCNSQRPRDAEIGLKNDASWSTTHILPPSLDEGPNHELTLHENTLSWSGLKTKQEELPQPNTEGEATTQVLSMPPVNVFFPPFA